MAKGRELKGRIRSVQNTRKITKTMELVATSKLKRAQDRVHAARPYAEALRQVISDLYAPDLASEFPLLRRPVPQIRKWEHDFLDYLDASQPQILNDIRTKKALDDDLTKRLKSAITAFAPMFVAA